MRSAEHERLVFGASVAAPYQHSDAQIGVGEGQRRNGQEPGQVAVAGFNKFVEEKVAAEKSRRGREAREAEFVLGA